MTLVDILETAGVADRDTINCDWESSRTLKVRGASGRVVRHDRPAGPWLVPGTWWSEERGLMVFTAAEWPGTGAVAELSTAAQGATLSWSEAGKQLIISIPSTVTVRAIEQTDIWYPRLPRIAGALPDFPVRREFVQIFEIGTHWSGTRWFAPTTNGLTLSYTWDSGEIDEIGANALVAVWPPFNIPGWKLYSVLMQGLPVIEAERMQEGFFTASVCVGTASAPSTFVDADQREVKTVTGRPDVIGLITARGGPRVLFLHDRFGDCGGGIRLLSRDAERIEKESELAIDFGTSHSAACWLGDDGPSSVLAAPSEYRGWNYPAIVRSTGDESFDTPWLLGYPAPAFENAQHGAITYIPSGLFLRAITETPADSIADWTPKIPFVDYCLMGPAINFEIRSNNIMQRWRSGLKWSENDNASQAFLTAFLIWITAVRQGEGATLRFSFPHAFSEVRRRQFAEMLEKVAHRAGELTGSSFQLAQPCFPPRDDKKKGPFVDEATPVIWEVMNNAVTRFLHLNAGHRQGILVADLGGGTLDLLFAAVEASEGRRDFRLIASESIQFGARAVIELIMDSVSWHFQSQEKTARKLKEALLEQWTRSGELVETILSSARTANADKTFIRIADWRGQPQVAAQSIMEQVCLYFLFTREYCARFVGGVLTSPQLQERIRSGGGNGGQVRSRHEHVGPRAPGRGLIDWDDASPALDIAIALTGNGWRFLELAGFDPLMEHAQIEDVFRDSVRTRIGEYAGLSSVGEISLEGISTQPKLMTSQGMLDLAPDLGVGRRTVEVAPNGCTEVVYRVAKPWGTFVSPAEPQYDLPPQQIAREIDPPLTTRNDPWFKDCVAAPSAARKYGELISRPLDWNSVTKRQGGGLSTRQISTSRALWETVVRGYLGLSAIG